jgi:hypothetical protein
MVGKKNRSPLKSTSKLALGYLWRIGFITAALLFLILTAGYAGESSFHLLTNRYKKVTDILNDKKIPSLAAAADMSVEDYVNFQIKRLVIIKAILEQPVVVKFITLDGSEEETILTHPISGVTLYYSDFLVDRSGPKFLGALNPHTAIDMLLPKVTEVIVKQAIDLSRRRLEDKVNGLYKKAPDYYIILTPDEFTQASSIFWLPHTVQRRLSDFDLVAKEIDTLSAAIGTHLKHELKKEIPEKLAKKIGLLAWERGNKIYYEIVMEALNDKKESPENAYENLYNTFKENRKPDDQDFYHMLIDSNGVKVFTEAGLPNIAGDWTAGEVDLFYGLGVPFMGAEVRQWKGNAVYPKGILVLTTQMYADFDVKKLTKELLTKYVGNGKDFEEFKKHHGKYELGDIVTDATSHYAKAFSHDYNIQTMQTQIFGKQIISLSEYYSGFFRLGLNFREKFEAVLDNNIRSLGGRLDAGGKGALAQLKEIKREYEERKHFIDTVLMFEEIAKKEAQSQLFKATKNKKKLSGNISDITQFMKGAIEQSKREEDANRHEQINALIDIVKLSSLISMPRWGITSANHSRVGNTAEGIVDAKEFMEQLNARSYEHLWGEKNSPRVMLKWAQIDLEEAKRRISDYNIYMLPVWKMVQESEDYFKAVDALKSAREEYTKEKIRSKLNVITKAREAVKAEVDKILKKKLTSLNSQIDKFARSRNEVIESLTEQVDQSVKFAIQRETKKTGMRQSDAAWMIALWLIPQRVAESYAGHMQQFCPRPFRVGFAHIVWYR